MCMYVCVCACVCVCVCVCKVLRYILIIRYCIEEIQRERKRERVLCVYVRALAPVQVRTVFT